VDETLPAAWTSVFTRAIHWREVRYLCREKHFGDVAAFTAELLEQMSVGWLRLFHRLVVCINKVTELGFRRATRLRVGQLWNQDSIIFSFLHSVQTNTVTHPAFYPIGNHDTSPRNKTDSHPMHAQVINAWSYTSNFAHACMTRRSNRRKDYKLSNYENAVDVVESRSTWR
jgi:hypothetical protein